ncbi:MAG: hypothetical protein KF894_24175, partial [Labilithrix sp.]|nr:hypothetical protein [Labilithrix sp.]
AGAAGLGASAVAAAKAGLVLKIGGAVIVASAAFATTIVATSTREAATPPPLGIVATVTATTSAPTPSSSAAATGALSLVEELAPSAEPSAAPPPAPGGSAARSPLAAGSGGAQAAREETGPEAEVRLLERAQDALRARPAEALALADDHARRFPTGMLAQEREVIAIEALMKTGRTSDANARASRFKARFPGSSHTRRVDTLVAP